MKVQRLLRRIAAQAFRIVMRIVPVRRRVFVTSWPPDEGNGVEVVRALTHRYPGQIVWADPPADARLKQLGIDPAPIVRTNKRSWRAIRAFLSAEASFFTHGVYGCPRPVPNKALVNLWHGDGPKAHAGALVPSSFLVSGSRVFGQSLARVFGVDPANVILTGLPRAAQCRRAVSPEQLRQLGIDPLAPFVVWMPTYRQTSAAGLNVARSDTADPTADLELAEQILPGAAVLAEMGVQLVVKPHPSDLVSRRFAQFTAVSDQAIEEAGTTLYAFLGASAGLVTDYSSVWTDYLVTDRPIGFFMPDLDSYAGGRGLQDNALDHLPGARLSQPSDFAEFAREVQDPGTGSGQTRRRLSREYFGITHPAQPAELLLEDLARRGVFTLLPEARQETAG